MSYFNNTDPYERVERRCETRHKTYLSAIVHQENKNNFATVVNLSKSGLGILSPKRYIHNETFEISLIKKQQNAITVKLNVKACREMNGKYLIGTEIINKNPKHYELYEEISRSFS